AQPAGSPALLVYGAVQGLPTLADCFAAARSLAAATAAGLRLTTLFPAGQALGGYTTAWGGSAEVVAAHAVTILLWPGTPVSASLELPERRAPVAAGQAVGTLHVTANGAGMDVAAVTTSGLPGPDWGWRLVRRSRLAP
ncbi:MAG: hypothetical protein M3024_07230, partial [Candidatus Dormibacteraeota bacterium]|nr:hypothetical protein [Candidatus Dormibacteraeota bacterium]